MADFKKYHDRLQKKIGEAMAADKILEGPWWDVVIKDLNLMSYYIAHDIGVESAHNAKEDPRDLVNKGTYKLSYEEWPPMRLTAISLILSYWLGRNGPFHGLNDGLSWIQQLYTAGFNEFLQSNDVKEWLQTPKGQEWQQQQQQKAASKPAETATEGTEHQQSNAKTEGSNEKRQTNHHD